MKLDDDQMSELVNNNVKDISKMFTRYGYEIRIAGGAVRDILSGAEPSDLDFATTATPDQMIEMFTKEDVRMLNKKGVTHGTVTARHNEENFEFTTLRVDEKTDGRRAEVKFITDWHLDAGRRDLTVNSIFLGLDGTVYDYFNGLDHIKSKKVQFVGDVDKRIQEDYLRILRYFRFYGRISPTPDGHDPMILESIKRNTDGLSQISGERIYTELVKIVKGNFAPQILETMMQCDVFPYMGLSVNFDCENLSKLYKKWKEENILSKDMQHMTILAAGLKSKDEALMFVERVKCSRKDKDLLNSIIELRDKISCLREFKDLQDLMIDMCLVERKHFDSVNFCVTELLKYNCQIDFLDALSTTEIPRFPARGHVLKNFIIKKKDMTKVINELIELWKKSNYILDEKELFDSLRESKLVDKDKLNLFLDSSPVIIDSK